MRDSRRVDEEADLGRDDNHGEDQAEAETDDRTDQHPDIGRHQRGRDVDGLFTCTFVNLARARR